MGQLQDEELEDQEFQEEEQHEEEDWTDTARASKRPRLQETSKVEELRNWLAELDSNGRLLPYFDILADGFDSDLSQIASAKVVDHSADGRQGLISEVEPWFWDTIGCTK